MCGDNSLTHLAHIRISGLGRIKGFVFLLSDLREITLLAMKENQVGFVSSKDTPQNSRLGCFNT